MDKQKFDQLKYKTMNFRLAAYSFHHVVINGCGGFSKPPESITQVCTNSLTKRSLKRVSILR